MSTVVNSSIDDQELIVERRRQFVAAATALFGRNSYDTTTMKDISKQAGFSAGLIYSYVETKEDMLFLVLQDILQSYMREIPKAMEGVEDPIERVCAAIRSYCQVIDANSDATLLAYRATKALSAERKNEIKKLELETNSLISDCVAACIEAGYFRPVDVDLLAYQAVMLAHGWALKRWALAKKMTLEQYANDTIDLLLHGVMTEKGWQHLKKREARA